MRLRALFFALVCYGTPIASQVAGCEVKTPIASSITLDYRGGCRNGLAEGRGVARIQYPQHTGNDVIHISGEFRDGYAHGNVLLTSDSGRYGFSGEFNRGMERNGQGRAPNGQGGIQYFTVREGQVVERQNSAGGTTSNQVNPLAALLELAINKRLGGGQPQSHSSSGYSAPVPPSVWMNAPTGPKPMAQWGQVGGTPPVGSQEWVRRNEEERNKWQQQEDQARVRYQQQAIEQQRKDEAARGAADRAQEVSRREADARAQAEFKKQAAEQQALNDRQAAAQRAAEAERFRLQAAEQQRLNAEEQQRQASWARQNEERQRKDEATRAAADRAQEVARREADARAQAEFKKQAAEQQAWNDRQAAVHRAAEAERFRLHDAEQQRLNTEEQKRRAAWSRQNEEQQRKDEASRTAADRAQEVARREADTRAQADYKKQAGEQQARYDQHAAADRAIQAENNRRAQAEQERLSAEQQKRQAEWNRQAEQDRSKWQQAEDERKRLEVARPTPPQVTYPTYGTSSPVGNTTYGNPPPAAYSTYGNTAPAANTTQGSPPPAQQPPPGVYEPPPTASVGVAKSVQQPPPRVQTPPSTASSGIAPPGKNKTSSGNAAAIAALAPSPPALSPQDLAHLRVDQLSKLSPQQMANLPADRRLSVEQYRRQEAAAAEAARFSNLPFYRQVIETAPAAEADVLRGIRDQAVETAKATAQVSSNIYRQGKEDPLGTIKSIGATGAGAVRQATTHPLTTAKEIVEPIKRWGTALAEGNSYEAGRALPGAVASTVGIVEGAAVSRSVVGSVTGRNLGTLPARPQTTSGVWGLPAAERGTEIHKARGQNLPENFPVVDKWDAATRTVTSIKSLDVGAPSYENLATLRSTVKKYVDSLSDFKETTWAGILVPQPSQRVLELVVPSAGTSQQQDAIRQLSEYAASKGIALQVITYP